MTELDVAAQLRAFVAYNERANTIVLDAMGSLSPEELDRAHGAGWESLRATMQHVVTAQNTWLGRWGCSVGTGGGTIQQAFDVSHAALREFIEGRFAKQLASVIDYTDSRGQAFAVPLWQLVTQVCNHGTHHRAECGMLLGQLGRSPGDMDFLYFSLGRI